MIDKEDVLFSSVVSSGPVVVKKRGAGDRMDLS